MGKSRGRGGKGDEGAKPLNALLKKSKSPTSPWQIDYDYVGKLSEADKEWLNDFTDEYYLNRPAAKVKLHKDYEQLKGRWRAYMQNRRDVTSRKQTIPDEEAGATVGGHRVNSLIEDACENIREFDIEESMVDWIDSQDAAAGRGFDSGDDGEYTTPRGKGPKS